MIAFAALILASTPVVAAPDLSHLVDRYIAWRGGARFEQLRSVHVTRTIETGGLRGREDIIATRDGSIRVDTNLGPLKQVQVITPAQTWESTPSGQIQSMALVDVVSTAREQQLLFPDTMRGHLGVKLALAAPTSFRGEIWATVRVTFGDDDIYDMLIDPASGRLGGIRIVEERQERFEGLDDWRDVEGVRMPFYMTTTSAVPSDDETAQAVAAEINEPISASIFERPAPHLKARFSGAASSTGWINFDLFAGNRIFIPGRVNGRKVSLLLDSGASVSTIDSAYAKVVGVTPQGKISAGGSGGVGTAGFAGGVDVQMGNLTMRKLTVASIDLAPVATRIGHAIPFVLGDELFNELVVDIDFEHHRIAFRNPAGAVLPKDAVNVPLHRLIGNRSVPVSIEGQAPIDCEFDLGNGSPLDVYPAYYQSHNLPGQRRTSEVLAGAVGGFYPEKVASLAQVGFAGITFTDVPTNFTRDVASAANSNRVLGNIGLPILARFRLLIDYSHDRLIASPIHDATAAAFRIDRVGLALDKAPQGLTIVFVSPGSPAEQAGFKAGEIVIAINDKAAVSWTDDRVASLRFAQEGSQLLFRMLDGSLRSIRAHRFY